MTSKDMTSKDKSSALTRIQAVVIAIVVILAGVGGGFAWYYISMPLAKSEIVIGRWAL